MTAPARGPDAFVASTWATVARDLRRALALAEAQPTPDNVWRVRELLLLARDRAADVSALLAVRG